MINFVTMPVPIGNAFTFPTGSSGRALDIPFQLTCNYPFFSNYTQSARDVISRRALGDYITTSPRLSYGNHACSHMQITGELDMGSSAEFAPTGAYSPYDPYSLSPSTAIQTPMNGRFYSDSERLSVSCPIQYYYSTHGMLANSGKILLGGSEGNFTFIAAHPNFNLGGHVSYARSERCMIGGHRDDGICVLCMCTLTGATWESRPNTYSVSYDIRAFSMQSKTYFLQAAWYPSLGWVDGYRGATTVVLSRSEFETLIMSDVPLIGAYDMSVPSYSVLPKAYPYPFPSNGDLLTFDTSQGGKGWDIGEVRHARRQCAGVHAAFRSEASKFTCDFRPNHDDIMDAVPFVNSNTIGYLRDMRDILSSLKSIISVYSEPTNPKQWAKLWLTMRYGDRLQVLDTVGYVNAFSQLSRRQRGERDFDLYHSRRTQTSLFEFENQSFTMTHELVSTCAMRPANLGPLCSLIRNSINWGIWPTLSNDWDLIPFSFVVDWFADVQSLASAADRRILSNYYDILYVIDSVKHTVTFDGKLIGRSGVLCWSWYDRKISTNLSFSPFRCDTGHLSTRNVIDGASLIIQAL